MSHASLDLTEKKKKDVIVLQKNSKIQNALFQNSKTYLVKEETASIKYILLIRITNQESTEKLS